VISDRNIQIRIPRRRLQSIRRLSTSVSPDAIDRVLRKHAGAIGLDRGYSAHSMRAYLLRYHESFFKWNRCFGGFEDAVPGDADRHWEHDLAVFPARRVRRSRETARGLRAH
jgi:hypothetical protein